MNSMKACLKMGIGMTIFPEISVENDFACGDLVGLNWDVQDAETSVLMIWHAQKWCSPHLERFLKLSETFIRSEF